MSLDRFLERCGQLFFSRMRPPFFFILLLLPMLAALLSLFIERAQLQDLQQRFARAAKKETAALAKRARKEQFLERYSHANPYFLDQKVESLPLLQKEKEEVLSLLRHPAFPHQQALEERLSFLQSNQLSFAEEKISTSASMKETEEKQRQPVQMDESDLQRCLSLLEDLPVGPHHPSPESPQILIRDFRLKKLETPLQTEVFEVEMNLLKREFTKS